MAQEKKTDTFESGDNEGWARNVKKVEARPVEETKATGSGFLSRGAMGSQKPAETAEAKTDGARGPPRFFNKGKQEDKKEDTGFARGTMFGSAKKEEDKKQPERPTFSRGGAKPEATAGASDWKRGATAPKEEIKAPQKPAPAKADDGWSFAGSRKPGPGKR